MSESCGSGLGCSVRGGLLRHAAGRTAVAAQTTTVNIAAVFCVCSAVNRRPLHRPAQHRKITKPPLNKFTTTRPGPEHECSAVC